MTLQEFSQMPNNMTITQYEQLLKEKERLQRRIRRLSQSLLFEDDSLEVLKDEEGSDRYNKHLEQKHRYNKKLKEFQKELDEILHRLRNR